MSQKEKILQMGAEALIVLKEGDVIKRRIKKSYRLPELDERLRRQRTKAETKLLEKARKIIPIPETIGINEQKKEISMEFLNGKKLSEFLDKFPLEKQKTICSLIGQNIAKLHDADIIHGDLTTSNMILTGDSRKNSKKIANDKTKSFVNNNLGAGDRSDGGRDISSKNFKVYFIDFGLGFISKKIEDKAVDLHLLKQALEAKHFTHWIALFNEVIKSYCESKTHELVLEQLKKVETRGRYKERY